jgi:hypothetical protein
MQQSATTRVHDFKDQVRLVTVRGNGESNWPPVKCLHLSAVSIAAIDSLAATDEGRGVTYGWSATQKEFPDRRNLMPYLMSTRDCATFPRERRVHNLA